MELSCLLCSTTQATIAPPGCVKEDQSVGQRRLSSLTSRQVRVKLKTASVNPKKNKGNRQHVESGGAVKKRFGRQLDEPSTVQGGSQLRPCGLRQSDTGSQVFSGGGLSSVPSHSSGHSRQQSLLKWRRRGGQRKDLGGRRHRRGSRRD